MRAHYNSDHTLCGYIRSCGTPKPKRSFGPLTAKMSLSVEELDATVRTFYEGRGEVVRTIPKATTYESED